MKHRDELITLLNAALRAQQDRAVLDDPYKAIERLLEAREKLNGWIEELEEHLLDREESLKKSDARSFPS